MEKLNLPPYGQSVSSFDPAEYDRRKVESYNSTQGNLTGYDCQKCKNKGSYATVKEGGGLSFVECSCMKIRRCVQKMEASGLREVIRDYTFEAYQDTESWQTTIKQGAVGYAQQPEGWLLLCGQSGSGKTHLCTAVCRHLLLAGQEVCYMLDAHFTRATMVSTGLYVKESQQTAIFHNIFVQRAVLKGRWKCFVVSTTQSANFTVSLWKNTVPKNSPVAWNSSIDAGSYLPLQRQYCRPLKMNRERSVRR